jgi:glycosyltransferase involved in cell wall biosynthesis
MAAGRPVIATRVGGVAEAVREGETGLLCRAADPGELADKIGLLLDDPAGREEMGRRGRDLVEREFSAAGMIERTLALYRGEAPPCAGR